MNSGAINSLVFTSSHLGITIDLECLHCQSFDVLNNTDTIQNRHRYSKQTQTLFKTDRSLFKTDTLRCSNHKAVDHTCALSNSLKLRKWCLITQKLTRKWNHIHNYQFKTEECMHQTVYPLNHHRQHSLILMTIDPRTKEGTQWVAIFLDSNKNLEYFDVMDNH
jgi:hypothetical protein